jgi:hypothetical protein
MTHIDMNVSTHFHVQKSPRKIQNVIMGDLYTLLSCIPRLIIMKHFMYNEK